MSPEPNAAPTPAGSPEAAAAAAEAEYRAGLSLTTAGQTPGAVERFRQALRHAPDDARLHFSLAKACHDLGRSQDALTGYRRTITLRSDCTEAYFNMGLLFWENSLPLEAAAALQQAVALAPEFAAAHNNLGIVLQSLRRTADALAAFERATRANPGYVDAWCNAGRLLFALERWDEAIPCFEKALSLKPDHAAALHNLGLCHHKKRDLGRAEACYRRVLALAPDHHRAHIDLGNVYLDRDEPGPMIACYRRALAFTPREPEAFVNVGRMLRDHGRLDEALAHYDEALRLDPGNVESHFSRALILLAQGRYREGWEAYEWRCRRADWAKAYPHRLSSPRWNGEPFAGRTLLVHHEQGFGDTLQFVRYLPLVKALGGTVLLEVPLGLRSLAQRLAGVDQVLELSATDPTRTPHDLHIPLLSLPRLFGTTLANVPAEVPYLPVDPVKAAAWSERIGTGELTVGIVWSGSTWTQRLAEKSCPLRSFLKLTAIPGTRWVALQKDAPEEELATARAAGIHCCGPEFADFSDTAAAVEALDLVISVDTAVAHLAGAMRKPVWVLLPQRADWRWLLARTDSPWYPSMRLYRQTEKGSWDSVLAGVSRDLAALAGGGRTRP